MDDQPGLEMIALASTTKQAEDAEAGILFLEQDIPRLQGHLEHLTRALRSGRPIPEELRANLQNQMSAVETSLRMILGPDLTLEKQDSAEVQKGVDELVADLLQDDDLSVGDHRDLRGERKTYTISYHVTSLDTYTQQVSVMLPPCLVEDKNYMRGRLDDVLESFNGALTQPCECTDSDNHDSVVEIQEG